MADDSGSPAGEEIDLSTTSVVRAPKRRALWGVLAAVAVAAGALAISAGSDGDDLPLLPSGFGGGAERAAGAMAADMSLAFVHYVAGDDLPALGGEAPAYRLAGAVDEAQVRALAEALGLEGEVTHSDDPGWRVTGDAGELTVVDDGGGAWWYSQQPDASIASSGSGSAGCERDCSTEECVPGPAVDCGFAEGDVLETTTTIVCGGAVDPACPTDDCAAPGAAAADCAEPRDAQKECPPDAICTEPTPDGDCVSEVDCTPPEPAPMPIEPPPAADLPSEDEARTIALDLLAATGADVEDAKITVDGPYDAWYVTVEHAIDGVPVSGWVSSVAVGPHGDVLHASGMLAEPERLGDYPLIDTRAAIERLNEQQAAAMGGGWSAYPGVAEDAVVDTTMLPPCAPELSPEEMERCLAEGGYATPTTTACDPATGSCASGGCAVQPDGSEICIQPAEDPCASVRAADGGTTDDGATTTTTAPGPADATTSCVAPAPCAVAEATDEPANAGEEPATTVVGSECQSFEPVPLPAPEPTEVVLTTAERVLVLTVDASGSYLVPGYRLGNDDGAQVDVAAVADDHLAPTTTIPDDTAVTPATEPAPNDCEVLVEEDAAGTTHTMNLCPPVTTTYAPLLGDGEDPEIGVSYRVELILHCVVLVDWDGRWWSTEAINQPDGWTGQGSFTLTSETEGVYTDDGAPDDRATFTAQDGEYPGCD